MFTTASKTIMFSYRCANVTRFLSPGYLSALCFSSLYTLSLSLSQVHFFLRTVTRDNLPFYSSSMFTSEGSDIKEDERQFMSVWDIVQTDTRHTDLFPVLRIIMCTLSYGDTFRIKFYLYNRFDACVR